MYLMEKCVLLTLMVYELFISSALSDEIRLKKLAACAVEISLQPPVDSVYSKVLNTI